MYMTLARGLASQAMPGSANMRHIPHRDLLQAMKASLHDLENLKLLSPDDLEILNLRHSLQNRIAALERQLDQQQDKVSKSRGMAA